MVRSIEKFQIYLKEQFLYLLSIFFHTVIAGQLKRWIREKYCDADKYLRIKYEDHPALNTDYQQRSNGSNWGYKLLYWLY